MSKVTLVAHTDMIGLDKDYEELIQLAAAICVGKEKDYSKKNADAAIASNHLSILEHISFTFLIEGISRACSHQLVRHRIASYHQQSQRYTSTERDFVKPPSINSLRAEAVFDDFMQYAWDTYEILQKLGIPNEDARYVLPNAATTKILETINARTLIHLSRERCCNKAQWEAREAVEQMVESVKDKFPSVYALCGAKCEFGKCPEAKPCGNPNLKPYKQ